jgi:hypothetical protein
MLLAERLPFSSKIIMAPFRPLRCSGSALIHSFPRSSRHAGGGLCCCCRCPCRAERAASCVP